MSNITVGQILMDAQRMASRVKDLDALGSTLLLEAEGNKRLVESLLQFQDDVDALNRISNNKSNAEMVNRIQQQNAKSSEILKENRELKVCVEDLERAMELIMHKYRDHTNNKIMESKINFRDVYNERLWKIIREQREKIEEMVAVMQRAAAADDESINRDLEDMTRLRLENKTLRELLQISKQFGSVNRSPLNESIMEVKGVQTDSTDSADELSSSGVSVENANNNSVTHLNPISSTETASLVATDNAPQVLSAGDNNNGPSLSSKIATDMLPHKEEANGPNNATSAPASNTAGCIDVVKATAATAT